MWPADVAGQLACGKAALVLPLLVDPGLGAFKTLQGQQPLQAATAEPAQQLVDNSAHTIRLPVSSGPHLHMLEHVSSSLRDCQHIRHRVAIQGGGVDQHHSDAHIP